MAEQFQTMGEQQDYDVVRALPAKNISDYYDNFYGYQDLVEKYKEAPRGKFYQQKKDFYDKKISNILDKEGRRYTPEMKVMRESFFDQDAQERKKVMDVVSEFFKSTGGKVPEKFVTSARRDPEVGRAKGHAKFGATDFNMGLLPKDQQEKFIDFMRQKHRVLDERGAISQKEWKRKAGRGKEIVHVDAMTTDKFKEQGAFDKPGTVRTELPGGRRLGAIRPGGDPSQVLGYKTKSKFADVTKERDQLTTDQFTDYMGKIREKIEDGSTFEEAKVEVDEEIRTPAGEEIESDFVTQTDIGQLPGQGPQSQQAQFGAARFESPQITPDVSRRLPTMAPMGAPGQIPMRDAGAVEEEEFKVEEVVKAPEVEAKVPSEMPVVKEDFAYEEKDRFARDLSENPEKIEDMDEFELSESVNKIPPIVYRGTDVFDPYAVLRKNLLDKLGKVKRTQAPEAVGVRETVSISKEEEPDIVKLIGAKSPEEGAKDFVQRAQDMLQQELERYKSKEFELSKVDPKRFWNNATTSQKIWGAIGVMLGAIGGAMSGQPNYAANMIQKMIDADIDAQKDTNENKRLMKNEAYRRVTMSINNLQRAETKKFQKDKLNLLIRELNMKMQQNQLKTQGTVLAKIAGGAAFAQGGVPIKTWNIIRQQSPELAKRLEDKSVVIGDKIQFALNKDLAKQLNSTIRDMRLAGKSIQKLGELSDDINWADQAFKLHAAGKLEEARAHARGLIGVMRESVVGGGVMTEQDRKLIESLIPNPDKFFRLGATDRARLKFLFNKANDNLQGAMDSAGISAPIDANIKINRANIKQHLRSAGLESTAENIKKSIKILKKNKVWKAQSALKYLLQG